MSHQMPQLLALRRAASPGYQSPPADHHSNVELVHRGISQRWVSADTWTVEGELDEYDKADDNQQVVLQRYQQRPLSPRIHLDDNALDQFGALPTDLPPEVVAKQVWIIKGCIQDMVSKQGSRDIIGTRFAESCLALGTHSPAALYAMMNATIVFARAALPEAKPTSLEVETQARAVQLVSEQMRNPLTAATEANVWAVFGLGYTGHVAPLRKGRCPQQSFLKELQSLHLYGRLITNKVHVAGMIQLLQMMGGLDKLKVPGMAQMLSYGGLFDATRHLHKPMFPFIAHTNVYCDQNGRLAISSTERKWAEPALGKLTTAFEIAWSRSGEPALRSLLQAARLLADFTIIVENYVEGRFTPRIPAVLTDQRNWAHYALMSLPTGAEVEMMHASTVDPQYEPCRLACVIYSFIVVFPYPPIVGLFERLVQQLQMSILDMRLELDKMNNSQLSLQLWIVTMGAIFSIGLQERAWFLAELWQILPRLGIDTYTKLTKLLMGFLWHPRTSDRDCIDLCRALKMISEFHLR